MAFTGGPIDPTPTNDATPTFTFTTGGSPTSTQCNVDGGAFGACASPFTTGALADGGHTIQAQVTDAAGNSATTPARAFTVDTVAPTVAFTSGPIDPTPTSDPTPTFGFTTGGAPTSTLCKVDGGAFGACTTGTSHTTGALADGGHTIQVQVTDAAGNTATTTARAFTIDTVAPTVAFTGGPIDPTPVSNLTPTFTFSTAGAPTTIECRVDAVAFGACTTATSYTTASLGQGGHTVQVRVTDAAGNSATTPARAFTVDTVAPTVAFTGGPIDPTPVSNLTPTFTFSTTGAPTTIECRVDAVAFGACTTATSYTTASLAQGGHTVQVRVTDAAGNSATTPARAFTVDTVAPTVAFATGPIDPTPSNDATADFTFTTGGSPSTIECRVDAVAFAACTSATTFTTAALLAGAHTAQVRVTDLAGNTATTLPRPFTLDFTGPTVTLVSTPPNPAASSTGTFGFSSEAGATFECRLDADAFGPCATGVSFSSLTNSSHTVQVRAKDLAGNTGAAVSYTWTVNTSGPTLTQVPPAGWTVNYFTFGYSVIAGAPTYQCNITSGLPAAGWFACSAGAYAATNATYGFANTFGVRWVDAAGAPSSASSTTWTPNTGLVLYPHDADAKNYSILDFPTGYYGHHGDLDPQIFGGVAGGSGYFASGTAYHGTSTPLTSGVAYTVAVWLGATTSDTIDPVWSNLGVAGGCELRVVPALTVNVRCFNGTSLVGTASGTLVGSRWNHVAIVYAGTGHGNGNGGPVQLFIDGNPTGQAIANTGKVDFFRSQQATDMFTGGFSSAAILVDDLRVYNRAFSGQAVCEAIAFGQYDSVSGTCTAVPGTAISLDPFPMPKPDQRGRHVIKTTMTNAPAPTFVGGAFGQSLSNVVGSSFRGVGFGTDINRDQDHTLGIWFFDDGSASKGAIFDFLGSSGLRATVNTGKLMIDGKAIDPSTNATTTATASVAYAAGKWHHLVVAVDGSANGQGKTITPKVDLYLDGVQFGSLAMGSANVFASVLSTLTIGPRLAGDSNLAIDELKVWTVDLRQYGPAVTCQVAHGGTHDWVNGDCTLPQPPKPF